MQLSRAEEKPDRPATGPMQSLKIKPPLTSAVMVPLQVTEAGAQQSQLPVALHSCNAQ